MKRKDYRKPTTLVVKLQHRGILMMSGEASPSSVQNYNWNTEEVIE